jgi:alpha-1,3-rhamnosyltransferase
MVISEFPLVSIITPSCNHSKYIQQSIESVVKQTYKNIEYFVIDDGSTDESPEIIEELSKQYKFYFEIQENRGISYTLNKFINLSSGKYVAINASDDIWTLDKIELQVAFMENNPDIAVCFGNTLLINQTGEILPYRFQRFYRSDSYEFKDILGFNHPLRAATAMYRKSVFDNVGLFDEKCLLEDLYIWLKITHAGYKVMMLKSLMAFYRRHETNSSKRNKLLFKERLKLLNQYKYESGYLGGLYRTCRHYYLHLMLNLIPKGFSPILR